MDTTQKCNCCGSTEDVTWTENPYRADVLNDSRKEWICATCYQEASEDI